MQKQENNSSFQTPNIKKTKKLKSDKGAVTPLLIPPSPCLKRLGYGTGKPNYSKTHKRILQRFFKPFEFSFIGRS